MRHNDADKNSNPTAAGRYQATNQAHPPPDPEANDVGLATAESIDLKSNRKRPRLYPRLGFIEKTLYSGRNAQASSEALACQPVWNSGPQWVVEFDRMARKGFNGWSGVDRKLK